MTSKDVKLKPCPWCASGGTLWVGVEGVGCSDCGAQGPFTIGDADAIAAWNRRATPDMSRELAEALRAVRSEFEVEYHDDGRIACVGHDSGGLRKIIPILDAALSRYEEASRG